MSEAGHLVSAQIIKEFTAICPSNTRRSQRLMFQRSKIIAASKRNDFPPISKKNSRAPRRLVSISTADGRWQGKWTSDYLLSLQDLKLEDLIEDEQKDAEVSVNLSVQKHASFGFSVDGRIITSFTRKCSNCFSPYCRKIDTTFNVWILPSRANREVHLPDIGGDDPSVIYVKPGYEADLDSLIQETIRLNTSVKDTCSELCEKSKPKLIHIGGQKAASIDKRWSILLELKAENFNKSPFSSPPGILLVMKIWKSKAHAVSRLILFFQSKIKKFRGSQLHWNLHIIKDRTSENFIRDSETSHHAS